MLIRKKLLSLLIVFVLLLAGCSNDSSAYQQALSKTDGIDKGKTQFTMHLDIQFTEEIMKDSKYNNSLVLEEATFNNQFDKTKGIAQSIIYAKLNNYGIDAKVYKNGEDYYLISPLIPKIIVVNEKELKELGNTQENGSSVDMNGSFITNETKESLEELWKNQLTDENVTKLDSIILASPEGDVKAKEYTINLSQEDLKSILLESIDILAQDELLNKKIEQEIVKNSDTPQLNTEQLWEGNRKWIEAADIGPFSYLAYINRDNYIIEEKISIEINGPKDLEINETYILAGINTITFSLDITRWDIEKDIEIDFPEVNEDNSIGIEELSTNSNFMFNAKNGEVNINEIIGN